MKETSNLSATDVSNETATEHPTPIYLVSKASIIYRYFFLFVLTALGVYVISSLLPSALSEKTYITSIILVFWLLALIQYWYFLLSTPHRICWADEETLVFHSLIRKKTLPCSDITRIKVASLYQSYIKIVTSRKKTVSVLNHVNGLHDLISRIKKLNPDVETKGC